MKALVITIVAIGVTAGLLISLSLSETAKGEGNEDLALNPMH